MSLQNSQHFYLKIYNQIANSKQYKRRSRSHKTDPHIRGRPLTPTKYRSEHQKPQVTVTVARIPYTLEVLCHKIVYQDETQQYIETFDPDDPALVDRYPTYEIMAIDLQRRLNNHKSDIKEKKEEIRLCTNLQELPLVPLVNIFQSFYY